ncbi:MAG: ABC transporter substrate-binding protein [Actinomycetota bacterium]
MRRSPAVRILVVLAAFALLAAACGKKSQTTSEGAPAGGGKAVDGGTLRVAGDGGPDSMNPYVATAQSSYAFFRQIYPYLVIYNDTYDDFVGDFATDWEVSEDGKTWTFQTQPDAQWSDNKPLTANDAAFTFQTATMPGSGWTATVKHLKSAKATDENTLVLKYDTPVGNVLSQLQQAPILPEHIWGSVAKEGTKALKEVPDKAPIVGGGPWIMDKFKQDEFGLFEPNPNWYGEKPIIDSWGVQFFENDEAKVSALSSGEADLVWFLPPSGVDPLEGEGFVVNESEGAEFHDIIFNSNPKPIKHDELKDPQLRLALEYATNRQRLIETTQLGFATPGTTIVPPVTGKWHNSSIQPVPYDLERAKQILEEAGYSDTDGDGIRETPEGSPMSYELMSQNGLPGINRVAEILKEDWAKVGVEVKHRPLEYNALWEANQAPINDKTGIGEYTEFDIILWDWVPLQDPDFMLSVTLCNQLSIWSDTAYCNKDYDKMYDTQGITVDQKERKDIVWQMQDILYRDKPYIVMYYLESLFAHSPEWEGFVPSPQGPINDLNRDTLLQVHQVA